MDYKSKKPLLIIVHRYLPYKGVNGMRWINISQSLAEKGYKVTLIAVKRSNPMMLYLSQSNGIKVEFAKSNIFYKIIERQTSNYLGNCFKCFL
jgi:hypothetical protein